MPQGSVLSSLKMSQESDLPSWPGHQGWSGGPERLQATLRSLLSARRVVVQLQRRFVGNWPTTQSAPLRWLRKISFVAGRPPGQEGKSLACNIFKQRHCKTSEPCGITPAACKDFFG